MTGNPMCDHEWVPVVGGPMRCKWCGARLEAKAAPDGPPEPDRPRTPAEVDAFMRSQMNPRQTMESVLAEVAALRSQVAERDRDLRFWKGQAQGAVAAISMRKIENADLSRRLTAAEARAEKARTAMELAAKGADVMARGEAYSERERYEAIARTYRECASLLAATPASPPADRPTEGE